MNNDLLDVAMAMREWIDAVPADTRCLPCPVLIETGRILLLSRRFPKPRVHRVRCCTQQSLPLPGLPLPQRQTCFAGVY